MTIELIDRNKIEFSPIEIYNFDEHKHEVNGMALFKDIEKIPTVEAIPLDEVKKAREEIENLKLHKAQFLTNDNKVCIDSDTVLAILGKLIESEEK